MPDPLFLRFPDWISPLIIPGLPFRWYGLMYIATFIITYALVRYEARRSRLEISAEQTQKIFFWVTVGVIVGGRIFATTIYEPSGLYLRRPWLIFWPFDEDMRYVGLEGMSYHGALLVGVVALAIYARVRKLDFVLWSDLLAAALPLGYTLGRVGNFINAELIGRVTTLPWGVVFPTARRFPADDPWVIDIAREVGIPVTDATELVNLPRHPSQLYEAFLEGLVLWLLLWFLVRRRLPFRGAASSLYLVGYGLFRFLVEYLREPDAGLGFVIRLSQVWNPPYLFVTPLNLTMGQLLSLPMLVAGAALFVYFYRKYRRRPKLATFERAPD
jgi:phosphatidylglycerol:prolipoprotein diacylglycerol transferase